MKSRWEDRQLVNDYLQDREEGAFRRARGAMLALPIVESPLSEPYANSINKNAASYWCLMNLNA